MVYIGIYHVAVAGGHGPRSVARSIRAGRWLRRRASWRGAGHRGRRPRHSTPGGRLPADGEGPEYPGAPVAIAGAGTRAFPARGGVRDRPELTRVDALQHVSPP